jgi:hypothetical protein
MWYLRHYLWRMSVRMMSVSVWAEAKLSPMSPLTDEPVDYWPAHLERIESALKFPPDDVQSCNG